MFALLLLALKAVAAFFATLLLVVTLNVVKQVVRFSLSSLAQRARASPELTRWDSADYTEGSYIATVGIPLCSHHWLCRQLWHGPPRLFGELQAEG